MFFSILKWGKCDTERAEALLNNCQPVWLLQGELTRIQMLTHFFLSVSTRGHCYNTLDILLVYPRLLLQEMSLKMSRNVCVWLWPFLISPDKEHQAFCFLMTSVAFLYPPCCTIYKPDTKHDKKKKEKKNGHEQWKMALRRLFFSYSNSNPGRLGGSHLSCRGLIKKTLSAGMKFPSRHFAPHTYSPLGETKGPLTARL